ncbi:uncharacterized protein ACHE_11600S [Aspergillus chevalieri]|uniref:Gamma-glutamylcyclotransferase AIG2-like domain-containing protein n=1 Tax=Aspergillus chevalieri TaxID=182096 RepID=A0A7R7ZJC6_ASPCH|nr:uncharacterized protein ACHE_11600S [Aspergillus chevalieri]BCR84198.1 hypothetical protein ACHE_11600S [Aspergillus chevalieri]
MDRKFMTFNMNSVNPAKFAPKPYVEKYYFFYGTLIDLSMLSHVLGLDHEPELRPAYIVGQK